MPLYLQINNLTGDWIEIIHNDLAPITLRTKVFRHLGNGISIEQLSNIDLIQISGVAGNVQICLPGAGISNAIPVSTINGNTPNTIDDIMSEIRNLITAFNFNVTVLTP